MDNQTLPDWPTLCAEHDGLYFLKRLSESHETEEESEAQQMAETCPSSPSWKGLSQDSNPGCQSPGPTLGAAGQPFSDSSEWDPRRPAQKCSFQRACPRWGHDSVRLLFIWLHRVFLVARSIPSCNVWDLVP